jgi:hypothetical protein
MIVSNIGPLDLRGRDSQPAHVLDHPIRGHAGVEQERALAPTLANPHQRREARFGDERVRHPVVRAGAGLGTRDSAQQRPRPIHPRDPLLVDQQWVGHVVDQDR